jgi:hypothetical protein
VDTMAAANANANANANARVGDCAVVRIAGGASLPSNIVRCVAPGGRPAECHEVRSASRASGVFRRSR